MAERDRYYDKLASKVGKVTEFLADQQTVKSLEFVERPVLDDNKINVLVMGISGAGKSTLINAVLGEERARVGDGAAVTQRMRIYEREDVPFRMVDTVGLEYNYLRQQKILKDLSKWSEDGLNRKNMRKLVHCIWFCIDAQSKRVSEESLDYLYKISKMWKGIPIVVVFTKSYSKMAVEENEEMFQKVMKKYRKRKKLNVRGVVSVLARELVLDKKNILKQYGIDELIQITSELIPDAKEINDTVMMNWSFKMRKDAAKKYVTAAKRSAFTVTIMPTKSADEKFLNPIRTSMLDKIAKAYVLSPEDKKTMLENVEKARGILRHTKLLTKLTKPMPLLNAIVACRIMDAVGNIAIQSASKLNEARTVAAKAADEVANAETGESNEQ